MVESIDHHSGTYKYNVVVTVTSRCVGDKDDRKPQSGAGRAQGGEVRENCKLESCSQKREERSGWNRRVWTLESGLWTLESGVWTLDSAGVWTLDSSGVWMDSPATGTSTVLVTTVLVLVQTSLVQLFCTIIHHHSCQFHDS